MWDITGNLSNIVKLGGRMDGGGVQWQMASGRRLRNAATGAHLEGENTTRGSLRCALHPPSLPHILADKGNGVFSGRKRAVVKPLAGLPQTGVDDSPLG